MPSRAVAWIFILYMTPVIGALIYYFVAGKYTRRKTVRRKGPQLRAEMKQVWYEQIKSFKLTSSDITDSLTAEPLPNRLGRLLESIPDSPITMRNRVRVLYNGAETYDSILAAMEEAQEHIHIEYYTIRSDHAGQRFIEMMKRKASQGVEVRLLCDGVGSRQMKKGDISALREAGVYVSFFLPPWIALLDKRINYRNHRKVVVIDSRIGFVGGINIGDEYLGAHPKLGYWRDTHLKIEGDAVKSLQYIFLNDWLISTGEAVMRPAYFSHPAQKGSQSVQIIFSGPDTEWDTILEVYFSAISTARKYVWVTTPYFIPDPSILMALKTAALSGVEVKIIFPKIPDSVLVRWAALSYLEELMQAGVKFYQYTRGFVHSKCIVIDGSIAMVGTANMDMRSFFSNFEINAVLFDAATIRRLESDFQGDLLDCEEVLYDRFVARSFPDKIKEAVGRILSPLL